MIGTAKRVSWLTYSQTHVREPGASSRAKTTMPPKPSSLHVTDFERQPPDMTLAAVSSQDSSGGLFRDCDRKTWPLELPKTAASQVSTKLCFREAISHSPVDGFELGEWNKIEFPLLARAWAFQERILSPRVVYFGTQEIYWDCNTCLHCECRFCEDSDGLRWTRGFFNDILLQYLSPDSKMVYRDLWDCWHKVLAAFTQLGITYRTDRLPAISGIVKKLQEVFPPSITYCAGLWLEDPSALLWFVEGDPGDPEGEYTAPTWSWASVDQPVHHPHPYPGPQILFRIMGSSCTPFGLDPTGRVRSAELQIRGYTISAVFQRENSQWLLEDTLEPIFASDIYAESGARWDAQWDTQQLTDLRLIYLAKNTRENYKLHYEHWFMILRREKEVNTGPGTYRRLGVLVMKLDRDRNIFNSNTGGIPQVQETITLI